MVKDETEMRNGRCYKGWALAVEIYLMPKVDPSPCATQAIGLPRGLNKAKLIVNSPSIVVFGPTCGNYSGGYSIHLTREQFYGSQLTQIISTKIGQKR